MRIAEQVMTEAELAKIENSVNSWAEGHDGWTSGEATDLLRVIASHRRLQINAEKSPSDPKRIKRAFAELKTMAFSLKNLAEKTEKEAQRQIQLLENEEPTNGKS